MLWFGNDYDVATGIQIEGADLPELVECELLI